MLGTVLDILSKSIHVICTDTDIQVYDSSLCVTRWFLYFFALLYILHTVKASLSLGQFYMCVCTCVCMYVSARICVALKLFSI